MASVFTEADFTEEAKPRFTETDFQEEAKPRFTEADFANDFKDLSAGQPVRFNPDAGRITPPGMTRAGGPRAPLASYAETAESLQEADTPLARFIAPRPTLTEPRVTLPKPSIPPEAGFLKAAGLEAVGALEGLPEFFTSDAGVLSMLGAKLAPRLVSAGFSADLTLSAFNQAKQAYQNWGKMTPAEKGKATVDVIASTILGGLTGAHAAGVKLPSLKRPEEPGFIGPIATGESLPMPRGSPPWRRPAFQLPDAPKFEETAPVAADTSLRLPLKPEEAGITIRPNERARKTDKGRSGEGVQEVQGGSTPNGGIAEQGVRTDIRAVRFVQTAGPFKDQVIVSPSVKEPGKWQATLLIDDGEGGPPSPSGHATYNTKEEAIRAAQGEIIDGKTPPGSKTFKPVEPEAPPVVTQGAPPITQHEITTTKPDALPSILPGTRLQIAVRFPNGEIQKGKEGERIHAQIYQRLWDENHPNLISTKDPDVEGGWADDRGNFWTNDEVQKAVGYKPDSFRSGGILIPAKSPPPTPTEAPPPVVEARPPEPAISEAATVGKGKEGVTGADVAAPARTDFAQKAIPALEQRIGDLHGLLINSEGFAGSEFYDGSFPIPREGGIIAARQTQKYRSDPVYAAKVDAAINDITDTMVRANRQRMALMDKPNSGAFGVDYSVGKARATYGVNVVRAWHNEAKNVYDTRLLGNISIREGFQNSLDAVMAAIQNGEIRRGTIKINTQSYDNKGFKIDDNGIGMSDVDIGDKFLSLHSSGKAVQGRFGGFGIAKAVILGPADSGTWTLHTRDNKFSHELASKNEQVETAPRRQGTEIEVITPEEILDEQAKQYVETSELPKNISVEYDGTPTKNPFRRLKSAKQTEQLNPETSYEMAYYPHAPAGYDGKFIIRLVDPKTGAKLTQAIRDAGTDGFHGTVMVDITTSTVPGTEGYPLVDSRMYMKWAAERPVKKLIEKHTIDPLSAKDAGKQSRFEYTSNRSEWRDTLAKTQTDPGYKKLTDVINSIWTETGKFFGAAPDKPFTPLSDLSIKIDRGYKGYTGGTLFQAKHLAAYEAVSRLMSHHSGANVTDFYAVLAKGGTVNAEHAAGGSMGLGFLNIDKTSLKSPYAYACYLRDLVAHELTHDFYGPHNEEFTSKLGEVQRQTGHLLPYVLRIAEAALGKEIPKEIVEKRVEVPVQVRIEVPVEKTTFVDRYLSPRQQQFIYDNIDESPHGKAKDDLYQPAGPAMAGQLELAPRGTGERPAGFGGAPEVPPTGGGVEQPRPPSPVGPEPTGVGTGPALPPKVEPTPAPPAETGEGMPPGPGAQTAGTDVPPGAQIEQLSQAFRQITAEKTPFLQKVKEAFDLGKKRELSQNLIARTLSALKTSGDYLIQTWQGQRQLDPILRAKGELSAELETRGWRLRQAMKDMKRAVPSKAVREAISKYVDAGGDVEKLRQSAESVPAGRRAPYIRAMQLTPDEKIIAGHIRSFFDARLQEAMDAGVLSHGVEDYLHRIYPKDTTWRRGVINAVQNALLDTRTPGLAKQRVFQLDAEAERAGHLPVNDFIPRIIDYEASLSKVIASRAAVKRFTEIKMPDGRPMLDVSGIGVPIENAEGIREATLIKPSFRPGEKQLDDSGKPTKNYRMDYQSRDYPALKKWKWATNDAEGKPIFVQGDVLVHPDAVHRVDALLEPSKVKRYAAARAALTVGSVFKQTMLDFSGFHQVQIAIHGLEHKVNPFRLVKDVDTNNPDIQGLLKGGMTLGGQHVGGIYEEGLAGRSLSRQIPGLGELMQSYHDWLFQDFIPRVKTTMAIHALERNKARFAKELASGQMKPEALYHQTAKEANAAFGEQNYIMLERSKTAQDMARLILLAPDFLESRARFALQAGTRLGGEQRMALLLGALTLYTTARIMNKAINDEWHFEPENMFSVIYNGKSYSVRTVQGDILHLMESPVRFWMHRLNPTITRPLFELVTQRDEFGRKRSFWQILGDTISNVVPISMRNSREQSIWTSMLNAFGGSVRRDSDVGRVYQEAAKWKAKNGIRTEPGEFIYDSSKDVYRPLKLALLDGNTEGAAKEYQKLIASKAVTPSQAIRHFQSYANAPFSGSKANEQRFVQSLTKDQRHAYEGAKQEKQRVLREFLKARQLVPGSQGTIPSFVPTVQQR